MKKTLAFFLALLLAVSGFAGPISGGSAGAPFVGANTYANTIAVNPCSSSINGYEAFITDWGANGAKVRCNGTRWLPIGGRVLLAHLGAQVSGIANTATIVLASPAMPIGTIQAGDAFVFDIYGLTKSGATDSLNVSVYVGAAGTTSDTALITANTVLGAAGRAGSSLLPLKVASNTSVQRVGTVSGLGVYSNTVTVAAPGAVTITDASANVLYLSFSIVSSGTTDTVGIQDGAIWQIVN